MKFSIKDFFNKFLQFPGNLVTFTEEILNGKFHFLCSAYCPTNLLFFDIPLLCHYIYLRSSIIFYLSPGDIYLFLDISLSSLFVAVSELFCTEVFEIFVILLAILLPLKSPVASAVF